MRFAKVPWKHKPLSYRSSWNKCKTYGLTRISARISARINSEFLCKKKRTTWTFFTICKWSLEANVKLPLIRWTLEPTRKWHNSIHICTFNQSINQKEWVSGIGFDKNVVSFSAVFKTKSIWRNANRLWNCIKIIIYRYGKYKRMCLYAILDINFELKI